MNQQKSLLLFGGRICQELSRQPFLSKDYQVTYIDSLLNTQHYPDAVLPKEIGTDIRPDLLVIDFQAVIEECISNTLTVDRAVVWTKQFASHLLSHIAPEQILLLHVFRPQYYVIKNRIRVKASNPYLQYIQTIEQAFLDQVDCHIISLDNCYFSFKPFNEKLALYRFEDAYYQDIAHRVHVWFQSKTDIFNTPPYFPLSLERFCTYFNTLEKKAFHLFLNDQHLLEDLVLCASPDFIEQYKPILLYLADDNHTDLPAKTYLRKLEGQTFDHLSEFCQIFEAFDSVRQKNYKQRNINYDALFLHHFRIPSLLQDIQKWAKPQMKKLGLLHRKQITFQNYGAWFTLMQTSDTQAFEHAAEKFGYEKETLKPTVVDLWGSCISRTNLNFDDERNFVTSAYLFQVPPFVESTPVNYNKEAVKDYHSSWYDQIVQDELAGTYIKKLITSPGEWLLIDFFSLSSPRAYQIDSHYFTDFRGEIAHTLQAESFSFMDDMPISELQRRIRICAEVLKKRYGDHIIMIQCKRQSVFLTQERTSKSFSDKVVTRNEKANPLIYDMSQYFVQLTNCYYINVAGSYLSDEIGFMGLEDVHYEDKCYEETLNYIRYIVKNTPKQKYFASKKKNASSLPSVFQEDLEGYQTEPTEAPTHIMDPVRFVSNLPSVCPVPSFKPNDSGNYSDEIQNEQDRIIYLPKDYSLRNDGTAIPLENPFHLDGWHFTGWHILVTIHTKSYWYLNSGGFVAAKDYQWNNDASLYRLFDHQPIPHLPLNHVKEVTLYATWAQNIKENAFHIYYYTSKPTRSLSWNYDETNGKVFVNPSGSYEFRCTKDLYNDGTYMLQPNAYSQKNCTFLGWKIRIKSDRQWYWYMADGTLRQQPDTITSKAFSDLKAVLPDKSLLPPLPIAHLNLIVAEAVWDYDMHEQPHHSKRFKRQFRKLLSKVYHKLLK